MNINIKRYEKKAKSKNNSSVAPAGTTCYLVGEQSFFYIGHKVGYNLLQKVDPKNPKKPFFHTLFLGRKSNHAIRHDSWADQGGGGKLDNPHASQ